MSLAASVTRLASTSVQAQPPIQLRSALQSASWRAVEPQWQRGWTVRPWEAAPAARYFVYGGRYNRLRYVSVTVPTAYLIEGPRSCRHMSNMNAVILQGIYS
jgi:hypothetical protein